MPTPFEATTEELDGPIHRISVVGELDLDTAPILEARLREAQEAGVSVLLLLVAWVLFHRAEFEFAERI